ncbi:MAG: T9SS type A sorting domain-containing protein, partial [Bacteroidota bacterium]
APSPPSSRSGPTNSPAAARSPTATNSHPTNNNLGIIAGHRDGCATECPGENVYARLESIRLNTEEQIAKDCREEPQVFNIYPIPNDGTLTVSLPQPDSTAYLDVIDLQGRTLSLPVVSEEASRFTVQTQVLPTGSYILRVTTSQEVLTRKILVE